MSFGLHFWNGMIFHIKKKGFHYSFRMLHTHFESLGKCIGTYYTQNFPAVTKRSDLEVALRELTPDIRILEEKADINVIVI